MRRSECKNWFRKVTVSFIPIDDTVFKILYARYSSMIRLSFT